MTPIEQLAQLRREINALENERAPIDRAILRRQMDIERVCAAALAAVQTNVVGLNVEPRSVADCVRLVIARGGAQVSWTNGEIVVLASEMFPAWARHLNVQNVNTTLRNLQLRGQITKAGPLYTRARAA